MNNINLPPFYVGQRVIRIKEDTSGIKIGHKGTVVEIYYCCQGNGWRVLLDNISDTPGKCVCCCRKNDYGYLASNFAPIEENFQSISLKKVLETESPLISVN